MKTNEPLKKALLEQVAQEVEKLLQNIESVEEGKFQEAEQVILKSAMSVGRGWLEQIMNGAREENCAPARREGACGHRQRLVGEREKTVLTMMGKITLHRPYYQCMEKEKEQNGEEGTLCRHGEGPLEKLWGIEHGRTSPGVQKIVSYFGASQTLSEIAEALEMVVPFSIPARQVLPLLQPVGEALMRQEEEQVKQMKQEAIQKQSSVPIEGKRQQRALRRWYVELDGVMARMRRGSVPMAKEEKDRPGDVYREVKVGAIFEAMSGRKRSELVPGVFVDEAGPIQYVARRTTAEDFGYFLSQLAQACGVQEGDEVVVLGDGAAWIWRLAQEHFPQAVHIVDLWHAREHVWKVANAVYGRGKQPTAIWAKQACDWLSEGNSKLLINATLNLPSIAPEAGASRSVPEIEADYFRTNEERMRYPTFRAKGMHLGSGIAEAACKTVLTTVYNCARIKLTVPRDGSTLWSMRFIMHQGGSHDQEQDSEQDTRINSSRQIDSRHFNRAWHCQEYGAQIPAPSGVVCDASPATQSSFQAGSLQRAGQEVDPGGSLLQL